MVPWGIISIACSTAACFFFGWNIDTIYTRFGDLPRTLPFPSFPSLQMNFSSFQALIPDALVIALLAGIESLLSALVADGMMGGRHKSNCELVGQGIANLGAVVFGGIPATGAIAHTATNVKAGARTPIAGIVHALTLFLIIFAFAPLVGSIPLAALAAVLIVVAWNMSEAEHFCHLFKAPLGDVVVLLVTFFLTIFVDLTMAVGVGMLLAAFVFMKRMGDLSDTVSVAKLFKETIDEFPEKHDPDAISKKDVPSGVEVYEISGPFSLEWQIVSKMCSKGLNFPLVYLAYAQGAIHRCIWHACPKRVFWKMPETKYHTYSLRCAERARQKPQKVWF